MKQDLLLIFVKVSAFGLIVACSSDADRPEPSSSPTAEARSEDRVFTERAGRNGGVEDSRRIKHDGAAPDTEASTPEDPSDCTIEIRNAVAHPLPGPFGWYRADIELAFHGQAGDIPFTGMVMRGELRSLGSIGTLLPDEPLTTGLGIGRQHPLDADAMVGDQLVHELKPGEVAILVHETVTSTVIFGGFIRDYDDMPDLQRLAEAGIETHDDEGYIDHFKRAHEWLKDKARADRPDGEP